MYTSDKNIKPICDNIQFQNNVTVKSQLKRKKSNEKCHTDKNIIQADQKKVKNKLFNVANVKRL